MKAYTELPGFEGLLLEESYVLDIEAHPGVLVLSMDLVLTPEHPQYSEPLPDEQYCYRNGFIRFTGVQRLVWVDQGAPPATDATGEVDYGNIDSFEWDEVGTRLQGSWGQIELRAARSEVELAV
jgi:hypothetical protein